MYQLDNQNIALSFFLRGRLADIVEFFLFCLVELGNGLDCILILRLTPPVHKVPTPSTYCQSCLFKVSIILLFWDLLSALTLSPNIKCVPVLKFSVFCLIDLGSNFDSLSIACCLIGNYELLKCTFRLLVMLSTSFISSCIGDREELLMLNDLWPTYSVCLKFCEISDASWEREIKGPQVSSAPCWMDAFHAS